MSHTAAKVREGDEVLAANRALVLRFMEAGWNQGDMAAVDELVAPDAIAHHPEPGTSPGREGWKQSIQMYRGSFPDLHYTVEDTVAEGDRVVVRWTARATDTLGFMGRPPTGISASAGGINI